MRVGFQKFKSLFPKGLAVIALIFMTAIPSFGHMLKAGHTKLMRKPSERLTDTENRYLNGFPQYKDGFTDFTSDMEDYLKDNFAFRGIAIRAERKIRKVLGDDDLNVFTGKNDWLFLGERAIWNSFQGRSGFIYQTRQGFENVVMELKSRSDAVGAAFAATIVPNKATIYPEFVPERFKGKSSRNFLDYIMTNSDLEELGLTNVKPLLLAKKDQDALYYKTDTHWTTQGAFISYQALMETLRLTHPHYDLLQMQDLMVIQEKNFTGDLAQLLKVKPNATYPQVIPKNLAKFTTEVIEDEGYGGAYKRLIHRRVTDEKERDRTLVILGDSFSHVYVNFFKDNFDTIIVLHHKNGDINVDDVFAYNPDAVIFSPVERFSEIIGNYKSK